MVNIVLTNLSEQQRRAWIMRYRYGWRMRRIAVKLGISTSGVSKLLLRALPRVGLPRKTYIRIIKTKPRLTRVRSLSGISENQFARE